jgi:hypothetical protein
MSNTLKELRRAVDRKERAEQEWRAAMVAAVAEHGYAETARVVGLSRQAVRQLVLRARR